MTARRFSLREASLEQDCASLRRQLDSLRTDPGDMPQSIGCGDNSCVCATCVGGLATNGGCQCDARALRRAVMWWRRVAQFRAATISELSSPGIEVALSRLLEALDERMRDHATTIEVDQELNRAHRMAREALERTR